MAVYLRTSTRKGQFIFNGLHRCKTSASLNALIAAIGNRDIVGYLRDILYLASPKKGEVVDLNTRRGRSFDGRDSQTSRPKRNVPRVRLR